MGAQAAGRVPPPPQVHKAHCCVERHHTSMPRESIRVEGISETCETHVLFVRSLQRLCLGKELWGLQIVFYIFVCLVESSRFPKELSSLNEHAASVVSSRFGEKSRSRDPASKIYFTSTTLFGWENGMHSPHPRQTGDVPNSLG